MIYEERPSLLTVTVTPSKYYTTVNFNIEEVDGGFTAESVTIASKSPLGEKDYGQIVTAIIRSRYTADDVEAIVNNYLLTKTAEHKQEMSEMQAWRTLAKNVAKEVLEYVAAKES